MGTTNKNIKMAAESNTPNDIEIWIVKVLESCTSLSQIVRARRLIDFYGRKIDAEGSLSGDVKNHIKSKLILKYKKIKSNIIKIA
jgi:hypothetical protein